MVIILAHAICENTHHFMRPERLERDGGCDGFPIGGGYPVHDSPDVALRERVRERLGGL
jgi:hypothetical protein